MKASNRERSAIVRFLNDSATYRELKVREQVAYERVNELTMKHPEMVLQYLDGLLPGVEQAEPRYADLRQRANLALALRGQIASKK